MTSPLVGDLLERWPTLQDLQRCHDGTLRKFFHQHNCRSEERIGERIEAIRQAVPATSELSRSYRNHMTIGVAIMMCDAIIECLNSTKSSEKN